jgi:hypothetical protein
MTPTTLTGARMILSALALASNALAAQDPIAAIRPSTRPHVVIVGTFHLNNPGLDSYKQQFPFDIRSPERQREVEEVVAKLAAWNPTRIAVEADVDRQPRLDTLFARYPGGGVDTLRNEIYQIGFRLARRLGLPGVHAIDADGRRLDSAMTEDEWNRRKAAAHTGPLNAVDWDARFTALYRHDDSAKTVRTLRQHLLWENSPERIKAGHGHYLVGTMLDGNLGDYLGADGFVSMWYNRNLRMYSNVVRLIRSPEERVLLIVGAGHLAILTHLFDSSPAVTLVPATEVLR